MRNRIGSTSATVLLAATAALASSCGRDEAPIGAIDGPWLASVDTLGDTITVRTTSGSLHGRAQLVEELRIGELDGADAETFGRVWAIEARDDGDILIYDDQAVALRRFGPDGEYRGLIGRKGSGPGEYQGIAGMVLLPDERLIVHDFGNRRFSVYDSTGAIAATWLHRAAVAEWRPLYLNPTGSVFLHDRLFRSDPPIREEGLMRLDGEGAVRDTALLPGADFEQAGIAVPYEGGNIGSLIPFAPDRHWSVMRDGAIVTAVGDRYAIDVHQGSGRVLRFARAAAPVPVSDEERAAETERVTQRIRRRVPTWSWDGAGIPSHKPPIEWLHTARDGRLWVKVAQPGRALADSARLISLPSFVIEPVVFDVFEPDGRFVGQVRAPDSMRLLPYPVIDRDRVWAVIADEDGVQRVARFRIEWDSR